MPGCEVLTGIASMAAIESGTISIPVRRVGWSGGAAVSAALAFWVGLYGLGTLPWLGYAWLARSSFGAGPVAVIDGDQAGADLGLSTMLFFKGQEVVVDYDASIRAGSLWLYVYEFAKAGQGGGGSHYITESGKGVWTYAVPRTGIYNISIRPSVTRGFGRGFDLTYRAWWGARPAR
jgi:hypothetical protein